MELEFAKGRRVRRAVTWGLLVPLWFTAGFGVAENFGNFAMNFQVGDEEVSQERRDDIEANYCLLSWLLLLWPVFMVRRTIFFCIAGKDEGPQPTPKWAYLHKVTWEKQ